MKEKPKSSHGSKYAGIRRLGFDLAQKAAEFRKSP
jgi:hypothetical protein